eukprot:134391-Amphidinium_carterae.1
MRIAGADRDHGHHRTGSILRMRLWTSKEWSLKQHLKSAEVTSQHGAQEIEALFARRGVYACLLWHAGTQSAGLDYPGQGDCMAGEARTPCARRFISVRLVPATSSQPCFGLAIAVWCQGRGWRDDIDMRGCQGCPGMGLGVGMGGRTHATARPTLPT